MACRRSVIVRWSPIALLLSLTACDPVESEDAGSTPQQVDLCEVSTRVFEPDCLSCHGADASPPDLTLEGARVGLVDVESGSYPGKILVVPGDPAGSLLFRKMNGTQAADEGDIMPIGAPSPADKVQTFERWIEGGAGLTCSP